MPRPFVLARLRFPPLEGRFLDVHLLVDTGADRTILGPLDADRLSRRFGVALSSLEMGRPSTGVGGRTPTRVIEASITVGGVAFPLALPILDVPSETAPIPSLLGRDVLSQFAVFIEQRSGRVLLLEPHEAAQLRIP